MTWQQFLTEKVLKECWHCFIGDLGRCGKCGKYDSNRKFNSRNDMMDLYEQIEKDGKWYKFETELFIKFVVDNTKEQYSVWLFCLNGDGYADRCKMVAEFYGWEEGK